VPKEYFESEIRLSAKKLGIHLKKVMVMVLKGFKSEGAYDFFAVHNGIPIAIECKSQKLGKYFDSNRVSEHQIESLEEFERAGGRSYVLIRFSNGRRVTAYALTLSEFKELRSRYNNKGIPFEMLERYRRLQKLKYGGWKLDELFELPEN